MIYLDDILIMNSDRHDLTRDIEVVKSTLEEAGFIINIQKLKTVPTQSIEFLIHSTLALTRGKKEAVMQACKKILCKQEVALWDLGSLFGNFNWAIVAVPFAQANLRNIKNLGSSLARQVF
jgi:hypothetical protein